MIKASVVIPTLNRKKDLEECIRSIFSCSLQSSLKEVIVIDNNSEDGTIEFLKNLAEKEPRLRFTKISERNAIKARNIGFNLASGDIIIHIDDDIVVDKEWLKCLIAPYDDNSVGGVGGRLLCIGKTAGPNHGHIVGKIAPWGQFFTNFDSGKLREVEFLHGSNMSFRRDLVLRVKGLDPNYKINWRDDTDLCVRIRKLGYRLLFQPAAVVWHKSAGSSTRFSSGKRLYGYFWNREYFYYKNIFTFSNIHWSPIFTLSEVTFCMALFAKLGMRHLEDCLHGLKDGTTAGLRHKESESIVDS
jgi:GT2 family glycosyltransferase